MIFRISLYLLLTFIVIFSFPLFVLSTGVHALTFNPAFGVALSDNSLGAVSDITLTTTQSIGDEVLSSVEFSVPVGWKFADGSDLVQDAVVASGSFTAYVVEAGSNITVPVVLKNDLDLQGHKAHWKVEFGDPDTIGVSLDSFLDGDSLNGHNFTISRANVFTLQSPVNLTLTFISEVDGVDALTNPSVQGNYNWGAEYTSPTNVVINRGQNLSIPGTATSTGSDVQVGFNSGATVEFSNVSVSGVTTQATSETAPPEGTGQFQLSGGLYYDFNTTATIECPCTITVPYDPISTSDPKIYHQESGIWVDSTIGFDPVAETVTGVVSSFSFFAPAQALYTTEWLSPVAAFIDNSQPFELNKNQALPVNLLITDGDGNVVKPDDLIVQIVDNNTQEVLGENAPEIDGSGKHIKGKFNLKDYSLNSSGSYFLRVIADNTTIIADVNFSIK